MKKLISSGAKQGKGLFTLAMIAGMLVPFTGTAQADNDWNGHERSAHEWHRHHIHHRHYVPGAYVQQDPYVVYAPPVVVEPPSGINVIIPLHIH